ncbi:S8 family serine peptidase [Streptomyces sp. NBC_00094]|uniref:S8 family serine peptidase n=1 Tax=Streptomyces sp. NBC_00094 TaxID=2903620 RepID=UPI00225744B3|nr:S8 family serine peptidase [Streptomyces sp. NBC_00094]MCX5391107.1 S8 family serine peptidase [Streptomyces sp. NBC_00094]
MKRPVWGAVIAAAAALVITALPTPGGLLPGTAEASAAEPGPVAPALFDEVPAGTGTTLRVNVLTDQRADLASASEAGSTLVSYDTLPLVTLRVDSAGLQELNSTPGVVSVTEDVPVPPTLNESTVTIGSDKTAVAGKTGAGTSVAILDTGVATQHPFLAGRVTTEACFSVNDETYEATSLCPNGTPQQEGTGSADAGSGPCATLGAACSHGTHVAGIAAGNGAGVSGAPTRGVAPGANVIALQVFSRVDSETYCGSAANTPCVLSFTSSQIKALEKVHALKKAGTNIVAANMSLGAGRYYTACAGDLRKPIIDSLLAEGVATVVAAGNSGFADSVSTPGCIPSALTVGSTTDDDQLSTFSNRGALLDVLAPGTGIVSSVPGGGFASKNGTSMAAPHVTGALAVLRQTFPEKSVTELEALLKSTGKPVSYGTTVTTTTPRIQLDTAALGGGGGGTEPDPELVEWNNWTNVPIPDSGIAESSIDINQNRPAPSRVQVYISVYHEWTGDLEIDLVFPDGTSTPLRRVPGSDNVTNIRQLYEVDASAKHALGVWKLRVNDTSPGSDGEIVGWDLRFPWFDNWTETQIPDLGTVESPVVVGSDLPGNAPRLTRVYADIHHAWRGDLKLDLVAPDGRVYPLRAAAPKDSGDTIHESYVVDASASLARGTWKLRVQDTAAESTGSISGWMLTL